MSWMLHQFNSNTGLATHKHACKAKITAVASKLLEARKVNLEKKAESKQHWIGENDIRIVEEVLDMGRPDNNAELWIDEATLGVEDADASILVSISKY